MKGIYLIINPNNHIYVGEANNIDVRWSAYKNITCKTQPGIYHSLKKHGVEKHEFIKLVDLEDSTKEDMWSEEGYFCLLFKRLGYKILNCRGGKGNNAYVSDETSKNISESLKGKPKSEEHKLKLSISLKGNSAWNKGKAFSEETKMKMSEAAKLRGSNRTGKSHSEESKIKMSESRKGKIPWNKGKSYKNIK